jgi:hypothetical protein
MGSTGISSASYGRYCFIRPMHNREHLVYRPRRSYLFKDRFNSITFTSTSLLSMRQISGTPPLYGIDTASHHSPSQKERDCNMCLIISPTSRTSSYALYADGSYNNEDEQPLGSFAIFINGERFPVHYNLYQALHSLPLDEKPWCL